MTEPPLPIKLGFGAAQRISMELIDARYLTGVPGYPGFVEVMIRSALEKSLAPTLLIAFTLNL